MQTLCTTLQMLAVKFVYMNNQAHAHQLFVQQLIPSTTRKAKSFTSNRVRVSRLDVVVMYFVMDKLRTQFYANIQFRIVSYGMRHINVPAAAECVVLI